MFSFFGYIVLEVIVEVRTTNRAKKDLKKVPDYISDRFEEWKRSIELDGLAQTSRRPGLHDEPLKGELDGLRSVRLNSAYRVIYRISEDEAIEIEYVEVRRVTNHVYRK